ncbi:hypothetical protein DFH09DRAFT_1094888 [Mycena vulgaris]|nr:hypothetical protein DFH09DRAFT_1094888 [Mycena vulgaris]
MVSKLVPLGKRGLTQTKKLCRHADAQKRYVDRNLEAMRDKARARMELYVRLQNCLTLSNSEAWIPGAGLRSRRPLRPQSWPLVNVGKLMPTIGSVNVKGVHSDSLRGPPTTISLSKFINKVGRRAYNKHYAPLYKTQGNGRHLLGVGFAWNDEDRSKKTKKKSSRSKPKSKDIADSPV